MTIDITLDPKEVQEAIRRYLLQEGFKIINETYMPVVNGGNFAGVKAMCVIKEKSSLQPIES